MRTDLPTKLSTVRAVNWRDLRQPAKAKFVHRRINDFVPFGRKLMEMGFWYNHLCWECSFPPSGCIITSCKKYWKVSQSWFEKPSQPLLAFLLVCYPHPRLISRNSKLWRTRMNVCWKIWKPRSPSWSWPKLMLTALSRNASRVFKLVWTVWSSRLTSFLGVLLALDRMQVPHRRPLEPLGICRRLKGSRWSWLICMDLFW